MVNDIFEKLQNNKEHYLKSKKGKDFEDRIGDLISDYYTKIIKDDFEKVLKKSKNEILCKTNESFIENDSSKTNKTSHFITQPYGSQSYPDVLIFSKNIIIPIEIKFTENEKGNPFWNSGIPRLNGVYVFGSYGLKDLTFFMGKILLLKKI